MPKGVLWRQADFLAACLGVTQPLDQLVARAATTDLRALPAPPFMHGAAHWNALSAHGSRAAPWSSRTSPPTSTRVDLLDTVERERCPSLLIVGDAFARPLVDALRHRSDPHDVRLRYLLTGGALLSASVKDELLDLVPGLRIVDVLGSSETGRQGVRPLRPRPGRPRTGPLRAGAHGAWCSPPDRDRVLEAGDPELGWLAQTGPVPLGYLGDPDQDGGHLPDHRRRPLRHRRRPGPAARRRPRRAPRPRLLDDQHRRREGLRRGGRAGPEAPPGGLRRTWSWAARASGGARRSSRSSSLRAGSEAETTARSPPPSATTWPATSSPRPSCASTGSSGAPAASPTTRWAARRAGLGGGTPPP